MCSSDLGAVLASGTNTVGRLKVAGGVQTDIVFQNATDILQVVDGGILRANVNNPWQIGLTNATEATTPGNTSVGGILTAGTAASTGTTELSIWSNQNTVTINANIKDTSQTSIGGTGKVALVKSGAGNINLGGTNTYTGGTIVNSGILTLNSGASIAGDVTLNWANIKIGRAHV